jgi:hypothetical protein
MQSDQQRAVWAVVLSGIVLFLWQYFFVPKIAPPTVIPAATISHNAPTQVKVSDSSTTDASQAIVDEYFFLTNETKSLKISNRLIVNELSPINSSESFSSIMGENSEFSLVFYTPDKKQLSNLNVTQGSTSSELLLSHPDGLSVKLELSTSGKIFLMGTLPKGYGYGISGKSQAIDGSLNLRKYAYHINDLNTVEVGDNGDDSGALKWVGIDYAYHFLGLVSPDSPATDVSFNTQGYFVSRSFPLNEKINSYIIFVKKEYDFLKSLGDSLHLTVDFGMFAFLAVPMLWLLNVFNGFFFKLWLVHSVTYVINSFINFSPTVVFS